MNAPTINFEQRVEQYVRLRDKIKELDDTHKEKMAPFRETLEQLNGVLLSHLQATNQESARTAAGTVYKSMRKSATIADADAFMAHVKATGNFDMLDKRANSTAVEDYINQHNTPPPGVNYNTQYVVGVRRA